MCLVIAGSDWIVLKEVASGHGRKGGEWRAGSGTRRLCTVVLRKNYQIDSPSEAPHFAYLMLVFPQQVVAFGLTGIICVPCLMRCKPILTHPPNP